MNFKQIQYAMTLTHEKSFSGAAECLNISQPSLSQYISKLEKELGAVLFERAAGAIRLTQAGELFISAAARIQSAHRQLLQQLEDLKADKIGTVVIGVSPYRSANIMPQVVSRFHALYPEMNIVLDERVSAEIKEGAEIGDFDLGISTLPINEKLFEYKKILSEEILLAVPEQVSRDCCLRQAAQKGKKHVLPYVDIRLLREVPFIQLGRDQSFQKLVDMIFVKANLTPRKFVECRNIEAVHSMVENGLGAALIPYSYIKFRPKIQSVDYFSLLQADTHRDMVVFYPRNQYLREPVKQLIKLLSQL